MNTTTLREINLKNWKDKLNDYVLYDLEIEDEKKRDIEDIIEWVLSIQKEEFESEINKLKN